ncbi:MAG: hypothetical protein Q9160_009058 [Pyrenula sp. 1 TL-2023]
MHGYLFHVLAVTAHVLLSRPFRSTAAVVKDGQLTSRSHVSGACLPEHQAIVQLFLLRGIKDVAFWGAETVEDRPVLRGTQLDPHHDQIFVREVKERVRRWFGQGREFRPNGVIPLWELHVETGSTPPGGPLYDTGTRARNVLIDCDYSRRNQDATRLEPERARIVLGRRFWTFPILPDHDADPRAETQLGLLVRAMLQIPAALPIFGPLRGDGGGGRHRNANVIMYFVHDVYSLYVRLRRAQREGN